MFEVSRPDKKLTLAEEREEEEEEGGQQVHLGGSESFGQSLSESVFVAPVELL